MKDCFVFDLDGTLCDTSARLHYIKDGNRDWDSFFREIPNDPPIHNMLDLALRLMLNYPVIFMTARTDKNDIRKDTYDWLVRHKLVGIESANEVSLVYMRDDNDYRPDYQVKNDLITRILDDGYNPIAFFDDKKAVIDMIRNRGYVGLHVADDQEKINYTNFFPKEERAKFIMTIGAVASGKSTYLSDNFPDSYIVCPDEIRTQMFGDHRLFHHDKSLPNNHPVNKQANFAQTRVWSYATEVVKSRLEHNLTTVLDSTMLSAKSRKAFLDVVPDGIDIEYLVFSRPLADKLSSKGWRSEELVKHFDEKWNNCKKQILSGDKNPKIKVVHIEG